MAGFRRAKITSRAVAALRPGEVLGDTDLPGFFVRRQKDARVYFVRKHAHGRRHFVSIGEHGREGWTERRARDQALIIIAALKQGHDPTRERMKARTTPTLAEFAETFLEQRRGILKPTTLAVYRSLLDVHIAPPNGAGEPAGDRLGRLALDRVGRSDMIALHRGLAHKPRTANHVLAFLSSVYSEAQKAGLVDEDFNPTWRIARYTIQPRQRFLSEDELARVGEALSAAEHEGSEDIYAIAAIRLLIFTGCRRNEILEARWDWVDLERGVLNLPDSKAGAKSVYLSPPALDLLRALPSIAGNPHIIAGQKPGRHWVNLRKVWVRIRERAGLEPTIAAGGEAQQVRLHDLRHSFASMAAAGGASLLMIGKLLGHSQPQTTARYAHLADASLRRINAEVGEKAAAAMAAATKSEDEKNGS